MIKPKPRSAFNLRALARSSRTEMAGDIVDKYLGVGQRAGSHGQLGPIAFAQKTAAQAGAIHPSFRTEHADGQLLLGHLQGEYRRGNLRVDGGVLGHVQTQGGLAHARSASHDDEVGILKTRRLSVQILEARRDTGDQLFLFIELLNDLKALLDDLFNGIKGRLYPILRYAERWPAPPHRASLQVPCLPENFGSLSPWRC